jgi:TolB-like protein
MNGEEPRRLLSRARDARIFQVLGVYLAASFGVVQVVDIFINRFGLPDWFFPGAIVLLIVGVPIILATAMLQAPQRDATAAGDIASPPSSVVTPDEASPPIQRRHWLTWRRALLGGVGAFGALLVVALGYLALRASGIGPIGSLMAKGVVRARDGIIIADFHSQNADSSLAQIVTEAFRVDFAQSEAVTVVAPDHVRDVLRQMQRPADTRLDAMVAREVAQRDGTRAIVTGEIGSAGRGMVLAAQLVSASDGSVLAAFREEARDSAALLPAIDKLSKKLRTKIGESLRAIRSNDRLEQVTTSSLDALRMYTLAVRANDVEGNPSKAISLLEDAITRDTTFAMAYRKLAAIVSNVGESRKKYLWASAKAYQYRDRLTERDRYMTAAFYHYQRRNLESAINVYQSLLEIYPHERGALNNLGLAYYLERDIPRARETLLRITQTDSSAYLTYGNLIQAQIALRDVKGIQRTLAYTYAHFPENAIRRVDSVIVLESSLQYDAARQAGRALQSREHSRKLFLAYVSRLLAEAEATTGRLVQGEQEYAASMAASSERHAPLDVLAGAIASAQIHALVRVDPAHALAVLEQALAQYPIEQLEDEDRPYLGLAAVYAMTGRLDRAKALVAQADRWPAEVQHIVSPQRHHAAGVIALAEHRATDALVEFRAADQGFCLVCELPWIARALEASGHPDSAAAAYEHYVDQPDFERHASDPLFLAAAYERLGDLYAASNPQKSAHYYNAFITLWKNADPQLQPRVQAARRRLEGLGTDRPR